MMVPDENVMTVLSVRSVSKAFGGVRAVNEVSFEIGPGEFLAMIGPNGAGKSTCFNMINGQLAPDSGAILFGDSDIAGLKPREVWRLGIGRTFQVAATFHSMTVAENVQMALISYAHDIYRLWRPAAAIHRERALALLDQVGMRDAADRPCRELAYGDVKRVHWLAFAVAGGICGIAGGLFAFAKGSISPETVHVGRSIDGLVMVLLGGIQTLSGPIVGATVFALLQDLVMRQTEYWRALLGLIILLLVLLFPGGIAGAVARLFGKTRTL